MNSKKLSSRFHDTIGKDGLSSLSTKKWDRSILTQIVSFLGKGQKILDVGCGYGRIAIPLLNKGYDVYGIDLSRRLISELKKEHSSKEINQRFKVADMCDMPFGADTFDVVLCLWSVFDELLLRKEQGKALSEMRRVLKKGGTAFIESHIFTDPAQIEKIKMGSFCGCRKRILRCSVAGATYHYFNHSRKSMTDILLRSRIKDFSVTEEWFGWRERMITRFGK